jgi:hypothetical protein
VSIYHFYKRVPADAVADVERAVIWELIPDEDDEAFEAERAAGILAVNENTGELVDLLLKTEYDPTFGELGIGALELFELASDDDVGLLREDDVRQVARALDGAPLDEWLARSRDRLAEYHRQLGS